MRFDRIRKWTLVMDIGFQTLIDLAFNSHTPHCFRRIGVCEVQGTWHWASAGECLFYPNCGLKRVKAKGYFGPWALVGRLMT